MDEHDRPTVVTKPYRRLPPFPAYVDLLIVAAALLGSAVGVGYAGSCIQTNQAKACAKAELAADRERGHCADVEFTLRKEQERSEQGMVFRHQQAVQECEKEGNIPLMGIDLTVVCIARVHVEWTHSLKDPAPWL